MKKTDSAMLMQIWHGGSKKALENLLQRKTGEFAENILFDVWSDTIQEMYRLFPGKDSWSLAKKKDKLLAFEGKFFSLKNFEEKILGSQFELETNKTAQ